MLIVRPSSPGEDGHHNSRAACRLASKTSSEWLRVDANSVAWQQTANGIVIVQIANGKLIAQLYFDKRDKGDTTQVGKGKLIFQSYFL